MGAGELGNEKMKMTSILFCLYDTHLRNTMTLFRQAECPLWKWSDSILYDRNKYEFFSGLLCNVNVKCFMISKVNFSFCSPSILSIAYMYVTVFERWRGHIDPNEMWIITEVHTVVEMVQKGIKFNGPVPGLYWISSIWIQKCQLPFQNYLLGYSILYKFFIDIVDFEDT